ncbi:helix-turn-helix domain-containing protein [Streptomyces xiamenensis]|uniref:helix-turn-helix domain-containing protein n=1 Tax=Streptomyces xiamenensis TaxID=408015 RepID=UPI0037CE3462
MCIVVDVQADGPKIRKLRQQRGYGLRRFAAVARVSPAHLSRIERGLRSPTPEVLARIAEGLGQTINDLETRS